MRIILLIYEIPPCCYNVKFYNLYHSRINRGALQSIKLYEEQMILKGKTTDISMGSQ
jgi:hypothetical protein